MVKKYSGIERREFIRLKYIRPLVYKVCKRKTLSQLMHGYTANVSEAGLSCNIKGEIAKGDTLWLSFDHAILGICEDLEKRALIYQNGVIGKVAWVKRKGSMNEVGIRFMTRKEKNLTHIFPKVYFEAKKSRKHEK